MSTSFKEARFLASAPRLNQAPADHGAEVAFVGRSNAGKSSAINAITRIAKLARVSKTPGRTQQLVFFELAPGRRIVDLPGYGYAQVPDAMRADWKKLVESYITRRESLRGLFLVADARRGLTGLDIDLLEWCRHVDVPVHVLLTKSDKLSRNVSLQTLRSVREQLQARPYHADAQLFSAVTGAGVHDAQRVVAQWLERSAQVAPEE
jgi:GTP-binding protein